MTENRFTVQILQRSTEKQDAKTEDVKINEISETSTTNRQNMNGRRIPYFHLRSNNALLILKNMFITYQNVLDHHMCVQRHVFELCFEGF